MAKKARFSKGAGGGVTRVTGYTEDKNIIVTDTLAELDRNQAGNYGGINVIKISGDPATGTFFGTIDKNGNDGFYNTEQFAKFIRKNHMAFNGTRDAIIGRAQEKLSGKAKTPAVLRKGLTGYLQSPGNILTINDGSGQGTVYKFGKNQYILTAPGHFTADSGVRILSLKGVQGFMKSNPSYFENY